MRVPALATIVLFFGAAAVSAAQTPTGASKPPATPAVTEPPAENFTYQSEGRRDPFLSALGTGLEPRATKKGEGVAGVSVADVTVRGLMESQGALVAIIAAPDNKTYIVRAGDKFVDGTIKTVTSQGLVVVQEVNDPLSLVKQREIRKLLRSAEDAKK